MIDKSKDFDYSGGVSPHKPVWRIAGLIVLAGLIIALVVWLLT
ncbi:hypothetical protein [Actinoplanes sp. TBRC 11911]|nr:hypothetical protein [Actinoplanes sp. TBRC 11911]